MHYWQCLALVLVYNLHIAMFFVVNVNIWLFMCSAFSPNVATMLVGRLLVGGGLGLSGPVTALYVSEVRFTLWFYKIFLQLSFVREKLWYHYFSHLCMFSMNMLICLYIPSEANFLWLFEMVMHRYRLIVSAEHMAVFCRWQRVLEFWVLWWQVFLWHVCLAGMDHI